MVRLTDKTWWGVAAVLGYGFASSLAPAQAFPLSSPVPGMNPSFSTALSLFGLGFSNATAAADFDNDGRDDLAATGGGYLGRILALPGGGYGPPVQIALLPNCATSSIQFAADVTNDGNTDLVVTFSCPSQGSTDFTYLYPGDGAGQFGVPVPVADPSGLSVSYHSCFAANSLAPPGASAFIFCARGPSPTIVKIYVMTVQGLGITPSAGLTIPPSLSSFIFTAAGDINGDGLVDLVGFGSTGFTTTHIVYLLGSAQGSFFASALGLTPLPPTGQFHGVLADVNGDGLMDAIGRQPGPTAPSGWFTFDILAFLGSATSPFTATLLFAHCLRDDRGAPDRGLRWRWGGGLHGWGAGSASCHHGGVGILPR